MVAYHAPTILVTQNNISKQPRHYSIYPQMPTPQIALVGTQGSGKTVLTTVLATRLQTETEDGLLMFPLDDTHSRIDGWMDELLAGRWLPSTPPGTLIKLHWNLHIKDDVIPMWMFDSAGQDLTKLFSNGGYRDDYLSETDRKFVDEHINNATILLILLNPRDFLSKSGGQSDKKRQRENIQTIGDALAFLEGGDKERRIAFLLTAWDEYGEEVNTKYGGVEEFIRQELPVLHALFIKKRAVPVFPVAAVGQTIMGTLPNGQTGHVPAPNFPSTGLKPLFNWIADALVQDKEAQEKYDENEKQLDELEARWASYSYSLGNNKVAIKRIIADAKMPFRYQNVVSEGQTERVQKLITDAQRRVTEIACADRDAWIIWLRDTVRTFGKRMSIGAAVLLLVCFAFFLFRGYYKEWSIANARKSATVSANNANLHATEARRYADDTPSPTARNAALDAEKYAKEARDAADIAQNSKETHKFRLQAQGYEQQAEAAMNVAKQNHESITDARRSATQSAQSAKQSAESARMASEQANHPDATKAADNAKYHAQQSQDAAEDAQKSIEPQQYAQQAASAANEAETNAVIAQRLAEQYRVARPEQYQDWTLSYSCRTLLGICREHRATAKVPIRNRGGAGNITVIFTFNGKTSEPVTQRFERNAQRVVEVTVGNLPDHNTGKERGQVTVYATQR
jgi:GTPase SAR1 family protein